MSRSQRSVSPSSWQCLRSLPWWPFITSVHRPPSVAVQYQNISVPLYKSFYSWPLDGVAAGRAGHPHAAHCSRRYWREHRLPAARLWHCSVRRQNGGGENRHLLHLVAGGYVWHYFLLLLLAFKLHHGQRIHKYSIVVFSLHSVLHLCHDHVLLSQPRHAHEVNGTSQVSLWFHWLLLDIREATRNNNNFNMCQGVVEQIAHDKPFQTPDLFMKGTSWQHYDFQMQRQNILARLTVNKIDSQEFSSDVSVFFCFCYTLCCSPWMHPVLNFWLFWPSLLWLNGWSCASLLHYNYLGTVPVITSQHFPLCQLFC